MASITETRSIVELYVGWFNRIPDTAGLKFWTDKLDAGSTLAEISDAFYQSAIHQFASETGYSAGMTDAEFITKLYEGVMGRTGDLAPNAEEIGYWAGKLNGEFAGDKGAMVVQMIKEIKAFDTTGNDAIKAVQDKFNNKVQLAMEIAVFNNGGFTGTIAEGKALLGQITEDDATVKSVLDSFLTNPDQTITGNTELAAANLTDLKGTAGKITINDVTNNITINYDANTLQGTDHAQITIAEVPSTESGALVNLALTEGAQTTADIEQVTLTSNFFGQDLNENTADDVTYNTLTSLTVNPTVLTTLNIDGAASLTVTNALDAGISTLNAGAHTGAQLNLNMTGSTTNVTYTGSQGADTVTFEGTANNNNINLGTGNDTVTTGNGKDTIDAGAGNDSIIMDPSELDIDDHINGGTGVDTITITGKDDIQRTETQNVQSVEVFALNGAGTNFVVTDNLVSGGAAGLEADNVFTVNTTAQTGGHTIDLTDINNPKGFKLMGGASGDVVKIKDVQIATGLSLDFGGTGDGDELRIVDGATVSGSDFSNITNLETLRLISDSTQAQSWTLEAPTTGLNIVVDATVPQGSVLNITGNTGAVTVQTNANITVMVDGVIVPSGTVSGVTVNSSLAFTEGSDNLVGTANDDTFHATSLDQVQLADLANGDAGNDTLLMDFGLSNAAAGVVAQLDTPNISNIEVATFNTNNVVAFTDVGDFETYNTGNGADIVNAGAGGSVTVNTNGGADIFNDNAVVGNMTVNTGAGDDKVNVTASVTDNLDTYTGGADADTITFNMDANESTVGLNITGFETTVLTDAAADSTFTVNDTYIVNNSGVINTTGAAVDAESLVVGNSVNVTINGATTAVTNDGPHFSGGADADTFTVAGTVAGQVIRGNGGGDTIDLGSAGNIAEIATPNDGAEFGSTLLGGTAGADIITNFTSGSDSIQIAQGEGVDANFAVSGTLTAAQVAVDTTFNANAAHNVMFLTQSANSITDAQLLETGLSTVLNAINTHGVTSAATDAGLIVVEGQTTSALYYYEENDGSANNVSLSELKLLATVDDRIGHSDTTGVSDAALLIADLTIGNAPVNSNPNFSIADITVTEAVGNATVTITRDDATDAATINVVTSDGTATAGTDYTAVNTTVSFAAGALTETVDIAIIDDAVANEGSETFNVDLSNASIGTITDNQAVVTITDNDAFTVNVDATGTDDSGTNATEDASATDVEFNFAQGNYTYTIDGFAAGDVLDVLDTAALTVINADGTDGNLTVQSADAGSGTTVLIELTGVAAATDGSIFDVNSFNAAFGPGSLG
ncbi:MAG: Calx-beta domain-containing protein [bacterium]